MGLLTGGGSTGPLLGIRQWDPLPTKASQRVWAQKVSQMCCKEQQRAGTYLGWGWFKSKPTVSPTEVGELFQGGTVSNCTAQCNFLLGKKVKCSANIYGFSSLRCQDLLSDKNKGFLEIYCRVKSLLVLAGSWRWFCGISWEGYFA